MNCGEGWTPRSSSQQRIDQWFEAKTRGLNDVALAQLKQKWGTMQKVLSSQSRLAMIVDAMLVSGSIYQACRWPAGA